MRLFLNQIWKCAFAAGIICLLVYLRALGNDFIYLDDLGYVCNNLAIRSLDLNLVKSAFTGPFANDYWMPLIWISFAIDYNFWGVNPFGYHLSSILLHSINVVLVVFLADQLFKAVLLHDSNVSGGLKDESSSTKASVEGGIGRESYPFLLLLVGLLWGLHPLRVESVAWVSDRKDVLNGVFSISSIICYLHYATLHDVAGRRKYVSYYSASLMLFVCSLMSKPVSVVIPMMLLLADWYPLGRMRRGVVLKLLAEKLPFMLFSIVTAIIVTKSKSKLGGIWPVEEFPYHIRAVVSGNAVFEYCKQFVWPIGILPYNILDNPIPQPFIVKTIAVVTFTFLVTCFWRSKPWLVATWFSFVIPLLPVLAFTYNGDEIAFASRFTYLPTIVPSVVLAMLIMRFYEKKSIKDTKSANYTLMILVALLVCFYAGTTFRLIGVWRDSESFLTRVITFQPRGSVYFFRGHLHMQKAHYDKALADFSKSIELSKNLDDTTLSNLHAFRGETLRLMNRYDDAVKEFTLLIELNPHPLYYHHRGLALEALGRAAEAENDFRRAGSENGPIVWIAEGER